MGGRRSAFDRDELIQSWMVHHLTLIGKAAARLTAGLRDNHPEIAWPRVTYFVIDLKEVWVTVDQRVPVLRRQIEAMLQGNTSAGPGTISEQPAAYWLPLQVG